VPNLRVKPERRGGYAGVLPSGEAALRMIEFGILRLAKGEGYTEETGSRECAAVLLSGRAHVGGGGLDEVIGGRSSVFDGPGACAFWPRDSEAVIEAAEDGVEIALAKVEARAT
jgi:5-deoxy-D-glucuronate isomerase